MKMTSSHADFVGRRSEVLAELFLQELEPKFLARPSLDLGFDFLVGFQNQEGGVNTFAVEVKGTENNISSSFPLDKRSYRRLVNSNVPGFLLAVNVKQNKLFYAWPDRGNTLIHGGTGRIKVPVTEINESTKNAFRKRLLN
jgi:Domain of unknown function (DUF4365)